MENNLSRDDYAKVVKSTFVQLSKKFVIEQLLKQFAFLAWGPFGPLISLFVEKILTIAVSNAETRIFFLYVDFRTHQQGKVFSEAAIKNFIIQQNGTEEEKHEAEKKLISAFNDFVRFTS